MPIHLEKPTKTITELTADCDVEEGHQMKVSYSEDGDGKEYLFFYLYGATVWLDRDSASDLIDALTTMHKELDL